MQVTQISAVGLQAKIQGAENELILLDVREPYEFAFAQIAGSLLVPLGQLQQCLHELDSQREIVVICHHGIRSQQAAEFLAYNGFTKIFNLSGGIDAWSCQCDVDVPRY